MLFRDMDLKGGETAEPGPALRLLTLLLFHVIETGEMHTECNYMALEVRVKSLGIQGLGVFSLDHTGEGRRAFSFKQKFQLILKTDQVIPLVFMNLLRN